VLEVDLRIGHARPGRLAHRQPAAIGIKPPVEHPLWLVLLRRDETDNVLGEALRGLFGFDLGLESILVLIDVETANVFDGLLYGRHSVLPSRFQGPQRICRLWSVWSSGPCVGCPPRKPLKRR